MAFEEESMYELYRKAKAPEAGGEFGTGWLPLLPDLRDYTEADTPIADMAHRLGVAADQKLPKLRAPHRRLPSLHLQDHAQFHACDR
jgi:hypothetical protein